LSEIKSASLNSRGVQQQFEKIIGTFGDEFTFLRKVPLEDIQKNLGHVYTEAIRRLRDQQVCLTPGYDGLYGTIHIFQPGELQRLNEQHLFFPGANPSVAAP